MSVVAVFLITGTLKLSDVVMYQTGGLFHWLAFKQPIAFIIFAVAALAETNRTPFDLPEAEQELAGGYNVEYSSMKFALFFMGEYANVTAASAMMVTLFFSADGRCHSRGGITPQAPNEFVFWASLHILNFPGEDVLYFIHDHLGALDVAAVPV